MFIQGGVGSVAGIIATLVVTGLLGWLGIGGQTAPKAPARSDTLCASAQPRGEQEDQAIMRQTQLGRFARRTGVVTLAALYAAAAPGAALAIQDLDGDSLITEVAFRRSDVDDDGDLSFDAEGDASDDATTAEGADTAADDDVMTGDATTATGGDTTTGGDETGGLLARIADLRADNTTADGEDTVTGDDGAMTGDFTTAEGGDTTTGGDTDIELGGATTAAGADTATGDGGAMTGDATTADGGDTTTGGVTDLDLSA
jgi:hypothetical protein